MLGSARDVKTAGAACPPVRTDDTLEGVRGDESLRRSELSVPAPILPGLTALFVGWPGTFSSREVDTGGISFHVALSVVRWPIPDEVSWSHGRSHRGIQLREGSCLIEIAPGKVRDISPFQRRQEYHSDCWVRVELPSERVVASSGGWECFIGQETRCLPMCVPSLDLLESDGESLFVLLLGAEVRTAVWNWSREWVNLLSGYTNLIYSPLGIGDGT